MQVTKKKNLRGECGEDSDKEQNFIFFYHYKIADKSLMLGYFEKIAENGLPDRYRRYASRQIRQARTVVELSSGLYKSPLIGFCRRRCEDISELDRKLCFLFSSITFTILQKKEKRKKR